jgi:hypothetical protein
VRVKIITSKKFSKNPTCVRRSGRHDDAEPFDARGRGNGSSNEFLRGARVRPDRTTNSEISRAIRSPPIIVSGGDQRGFLGFHPSPTVRCLIKITIMQYTYYFTAIVHNVKN